MLGLIILLLLLLCVITHPLEYEAASSYLSEVPPTWSDIVALLHEHNVSIVHVPGSDQFQASVLLENGICFDHCPSVLLRPRSVWDVSTAVAIARMHSIPTSVRSGHRATVTPLYLPSPAASLTMCAELQEATDTIANRSKMEAC